MYLLRRSLPAVTALVVISSLACGGGPDSSADAAEASSRTSHSASTGAFDCADLVSEQEIDEITGLDGANLVNRILGDENEEVPGYGECSYELPDSFVLSVATYSGEALDNLDYAWDLAQDRERVWGLGDSAFLIRTSGGPSLFVRVGERAFRVSAGDLEGHGKLDLEDVVRRIATVAAGRA